MVPDYQTLMLPVLKSAADGEVRIGDVIEKLANDLQLSPEERSELLPSGKQTIFANRVHWAKTYLKQAGLVRATRRGHFAITDKGKAVLSDKPAKIDLKLLEQFDDFRDFRKRVRNNSKKTVSPVTTERADATPDEILRDAHERMNDTLAAELLERVIDGTPEFFERLIVSLLLGMGYGGSAEESGRALGKSNDGGVDGVIDQDPLGLDRVYVQAKRYSRDNSVGAGAIRDFFGSLDRFKASKGVFVTTSHFSKSARETAEMLSKRIVLIDGLQLSKLMIRHNVGCRDEEVLYIKKVDEDFFE